jgi:hypothetical protein
MTPDLSVVVPALQRGGRDRPHGRRTRRSVRRSGLAAEVILVDDGSTDDTVAVAEQRPRGRLPLRVLAAAELRPARGRVARAWRRPARSWRCCSTPASRSHRTPPLRRGSSRGRRDVWTGTSTWPRTGTRSRCSGSCWRSSRGTSTSPTRARRGSTRRRSTAIPKGAGCFVAPRRLLLDAFAVVPQLLRRAALLERRHARAALDRGAAGHRRLHPLLRGCTCRARVCTTFLRIPFGAGRCSSTATGAANRASSGRRSPSIRRRALLARPRFGGPSCSPRAAAAVSVGAAAWASAAPARPRRSRHSPRSRRCTPPPTAPDVARPRAGCPRAPAQAAARRARRPRATGRLRPAARARASREVCAQRFCERSASAGRAPARRRNRRRRGPARIADARRAALAASLTFSPTLRARRSATRTSARRAGRAARRVRAVEEETFGGAEARSRSSRGPSPITQRRAWGTLVREGSGGRRAPLRAASSPRAAEKHDRRRASFVTGGSGAAYALPGRR